MDGVDAGHASTSEDLSVWNLIFPLYAQKSPGAGGVEIVQLPGMTLIYCPCFTAMKPCAEDNSPVHLDLRLCCNPSPVPDVFVKSAERGACFSESAVDFWRVYSQGR